MYFSSLNLLLLAGGATAVKFKHGVGKLPTMGYDTYNAFEANFNASLTIEQARLMKEYGLVKAGYNTFILDDFYMEKERSPTGEIVANKTGFPDGMVAWTKAINAYGVSGSAYSSNGYKTCGGYPGAYGHELQDLETWRSWGWNKLVKYDNCYIPYDNITQENEYGRYARMADAIKTLAAKYNEDPFIYDICQWGWEDPANWAPRIAQSWRIDPDIKPHWSNIASILQLATTTGSYLVTNFYQHADLDMLEVGNNGRGSPVGDLTYYEQRTHFTIWALLKSNLLIGTDLRNASPETIEILTNNEIIAINQDPHEGAALAPFRIGAQSNFQTITYTSAMPPPYWAGNSSYGPVFMIVNTANTTQTMSFSLTENWAVRAGRQYKVRDMWAHKDVGIAVRNWSVTLQPHDVAALLLTDAGPEPTTAGPLPCAAPFLEWQCTSPVNESYILGGNHVEWGF